MTSNRSDKNSKRDYTRFRCHNCGTHTGIIYTVNDYGILCGDRDATAQWCEECVVKVPGNIDRLIAADM